MGPAPPEEARNDRQEKRKIEQACRIVQKALGYPHAVRWRHEGFPQMVVESYICAPSTRVSFPKLPMCAIGILLDGRKVRNLRKPDALQGANAEDFATLPNRCALLPKGVDTHWHPSPGSVNFAGVYISGPGQEALQTLTSGASQPKSVRDGVLVALTRQMLWIAKAQPKNLPPDYEKRLVEAFTAQLQWLATTHDNSPKNRSTHSDLAISNALHLIENHLEESITIEWLCDSVRVSPALFRRRFREATGMPVHQYIIACRVERARELIEDTNLPMSIIASHCGFSSQSHLTAVFKRVTGSTPGEHRSGKTTRH